MLEGSIGNALSVDSKSADVYNNPPILSDSICKVYTGNEHGKIDVPIERLMQNGDLNIFREIESQRIFTLRFSGKELEFYAGKYIGLIPINPYITIHVKPRVPVKNLAHHLRKSDSKFKDLPGLKRAFNRDATSIDTLLDTLADELLDAINSIRYFGLYKTYILKEERTFHPKGRINISALARSSSSSPFNESLACSWFDRTIDNGPNRCILAALESLSMKYSRLIGRQGVLSFLQRINTASRLFQGVTFDRAHHFFNDPIVEEPTKLPELRAYYKSALSISKIIIRNEGVSLFFTGTEFSMSSLIIDMADVFENYVRNVLKEKLLFENLFVKDGNIDESGGGGARNLFANETKSLPGKAKRATPDIVIFKNESSVQIPVVVVDAKYKLVSNGAERDDINQLVTYATIYGVNRAVIVMPAHSKAPRGHHYLGKVGPVYVYQFNFDLAANDTELEEEFWAATMREISISDPSSTL